MLTNHTSATLMRFCGLPAFSISGQGVWDGWLKWIPIRSVAVVPRLPMRRGAILQVEVNQNLTFSNQHGDTVAVTFPESSIVGPSLGSVRRIAERLSAKAGDYLTLVLDRSGLSVMAHLTELSDNTPSWETVGRMTGISASVNLDSLASALGCRPGEVRGLLRTRGDDALLEALPQLTSSTSLLAELAALETQIDNGRE